MSSNVRRERVASGFSHPEAPLAVGEQLLFSDVAGGGVYRFSPRDGISSYLPHRRGIGGMCAHRDGGVIVTGRNVAWKRGDETVVLLEPRGGETFSDLCADPSGRILVGSLYYDRTSEEVLRPGRLVRLDHDGRAEVVGQQTALPNGVAFSPDGRWLYHSDTTAGVLWRYPVHEGELGDRLPWADVGTRWPDGIAVAEDGTVWAALAHGHAVAGWSPEGRLVEEIDIDAPLVTSVCFGGPALEHLYVTTAEEITTGAGENGALWCLDIGRRGAPLAAATVLTGANHD